MLDGSASSDLDGDSLQFQWAESSGVLNISSPNAALTPAEIPTQVVNANLSFDVTLTVSDCERSMTTKLQSLTRVCQTTKISFKEEISMTFNTAQRSLFVLISLGMYGACRTDSIEDPKATPSAAGTPVAEAGQGGSFTADQPIRLNGDSSYDPDGDELTYTWSFFEGTPIIGTCRS